MAITQGNQASITATLKVGGVVVSIPLSAAVTAQLFADNNATPLGAPKALSSTAIGANWQHGVVVADFTALELAAAAPPSVVVRVKMVDGAQERTWSIRVDVDAADQSSGSALFPNRSATIVKLRRDRLVLLANSIMPDLQVSDDYLWDKLRAAEQSETGLSRPIAGIIGAGKPFTSADAHHTGSETATTDRGSGGNFRYSDSRPVVHDHGRRCTAAAYPCQSEASARSRAPA